MSEAHLYMIQNLVNGRMYIGVAKNPQHRWKQNYNAYFKSDRAKCGAENFQHDVIASFETQELAYAAEEFYIDRLLLNGFVLQDSLYNLKRGGKGGDSPSDDVRRRMSESQKGRPKNPASIEKMRVSMTGKKRPKRGPRTEEVKAILRAKCSGWHQPDSAKAKISATHLGISKSETTKLRMSEAQQRRRSLEKEKPHGVHE